MKQNGNGGNGNVSSILCRSKIREAGRSENERDIGVLFFESMVGGCMIEFTVPIEPMGGIKTE